MENLAYVQNMTRAAAFIEKHLAEKINFGNVASYSYMSNHNFWRVFKRIFHESVGSYIRKRRLTAIADKLVSTGKDACLIAEGYGIWSREVFFRSFKKHFGMTPAKFRGTKPGATYHLRRNRMTPGYIKHVLGNGISGNYEIRRMREKVLGGFLGSIKREKSVIDAVFFYIACMLKGALAGSGNNTYIVVTGEGGIFTGAGTIRIFCGTENSGRPVKMPLKAGRYAVFTHRGPVTSARYSCEYIFKARLPAKTAEKVKQIVVVPRKGGFMDKNFEMEIWIPI